MCVLERFDLYLFFNQSFPPVAGAVGTKNSRESHVIVFEKDYS